MMRWLVSRVLHTMSRKHDYDVSYLRAMNDSSPLATIGFLIGGSLASHRLAASPRACEAARLVGTLTEDCGTCTQLVVEMARDRGIPDSQIAAVVAGDLAEMDADTALGYRFAQAIVARQAEADDLREEVRARWGEKAVLDLTLAAQMSRTFPMLKAGLGFARSCQAIRVGPSTIVPFRQEENIGA